MAIERAMAAENTENHVLQSRLLLVSAQGETVHLARLTQWTDLLKLKLPTTPKLVCSQNAASIEGNRVDYIDR